MSCLSSSERKNGVQQRSRTRMTIAKQTFVESAPIAGVLNVCLFASPDTSLNFFKTGVSIRDRLSTHQHVRPSLTCRDVISQRACSSGIFDLLCTLRSRESIKKGMRASCRYRPGGEIDGRIGMKSSLRLCIIFMWLQLYKCRHILCAVLSTRKSIFLNTGRGKVEGL